ncbi:hypothetical protein M409DRAFT_30825 [Zasmidium cellare ATCC 36951]|uniref:Carbohydrate-binding module family 18 protein n=1 Tax=Zasmidium cellare ATCC 36951 TaxID=1080233 RepID=A0A6A6BV78_ZASCE|nr:uncharacterized protein M409DRAFT_30825 [Zasmidium cellare ATCC 36951]KAF2158661.1 hypothetical protein M409DRAFT_30825 [Zasmidium cellare ATCC 36951]
MRSFSSLFVALAALLASANIVTAANCNTDVQYSCGVDPGSICCDYGLMCAGHSGEYYCDDGSP